MLIDIFHQLHNLPKQVNNISSNVYFGFQLHDIMGASLYKNKYLNECFGANFLRCLCYSLHRQQSQILQHCE